MLTCCRSALGEGSGWPSEARFNHRQGSEASRGGGGGGGEGGGADIDGLSVQRLDVGVDLSSITHQFCTSDTALRSVAAAVA